jgi:hypothetical protein
MSEEIRYLAGNTAEDVNTTLLPLSCPVDAVGCGCKLASLGEVTELREN